MDARGRWDELTGFISQWFYAPDHEAMLISIAAAVSHRFSGSKPVWLFVAGQPGSGKTSVIMNVLSILPDSTMIDELSENALLSGFQNNGKNNSLLKAVGEYGVLLFPDFTVFLSEGKERKAKVAGQLRRLWDGKLSKILGTGPLGWEGKVSLVAAVTESIDYQWQVMQELGQRFVVVRWPTKNPVEIAKWASRQEGEQQVIELQMKKLAWKFIRPDDLIESLPLDAMSAEAFGVHHLTTLAAQLRGHVRRDSSHSRAVIGRPQIEAPTRLSQAVSQVSRGIATVMGKEKPDLDDVQIASRIAQDSVPDDRRLVFSVMVPGEVFTGDDLRDRLKAKKISFPRGSVLWVLEELESLEVIEQAGELEGQYRMTDQTADLLGRTMGLRSW